MTSVLALFGSGEFEPWARSVDRWCVEHASASSERVLVVPTASAPEGEDVFARWGAMGTEHYRALGLSPEVLPLRDRSDALRAEVVDAVADSRLIYFSGGNPGYLADTLRDTPFWAAVLDAVARGTALGGCSAGAIFLGTVAPFVGGGSMSHWVPGLRLLDKAYVMPHFDALEGYQPGLRALFLGRCPDGATPVGLDERTAMYGDGERWTVAGRGKAWIGDESRTEEGLTPYGNGASVLAPLGVRLP